MVVLCVWKGLLRQIWFNKHLKNTLLLVLCKVRAVHIVVVMLMHQQTLLRRKGEEGYTHSEKDPNNHVHVPLQLPLLCTKG